MKSADLATGSGRMWQAWRVLNARWEQTQQQWRDPASQTFEEEYFAELEPTLTAALERIASLSQIIHAAEEECS